MPYLEDEVQAHDPYLGARGGPMRPPSAAKARRAAAWLARGGVAGAALRRPHHKGRHHGRVNYGPTAVAHPGRHPHHPRPEAPHVAQARRVRAARPQAGFAELEARMVRRGPRPNITTGMPPMPTQEPAESARRRRQRAFMYHQHGSSGLDRAQRLRARGYGLGDMDLNEDATLADLAAKSKRPSLGKNLKGAFKVARGTIGFKKGLSQSQLKKASVARKIGVVAAAVTAVALTGGSAAGLVKGAMSAGNLAKINAARAAIKKVRTAFGLPPISLASLKKAPAQQAAAEQQIAQAEAQAGEAVASGAMTEAQAAEWLKIKQEQILLAQQQAADAAARLRETSPTGAPPANGASGTQTAEDTGGTAVPGGEPPKGPIQVQAGIGAGKIGIAIVAMLIAGSLLGGKGRKTARTRA